jgi:hypothetical protein
LILIDFSSLSIASVLVIFTELQLNT